MGSFIHVLKHSRGMNIGAHVTLLSDPTVHSLYCGNTESPSPCVVTLTQKHGRKLQL